MHADLHLAFAIADINDISATHCHCPEQSLLTLGCVAEPVDDQWLFKIVAAQASNFSPL